MKNSHLLLATPALSSVNRDMTDILNRDMDKMLSRGRRLRSEAFYQTFQSLGAWLGRGIKAIRQGHKRRVSIRQLSALDDYILRDIGLSRPEIRSAVDGLFRLSQHEAEADGPFVQELAHKLGPVTAPGQSACNDPVPAKVANL